MVQHEFVGSAGKGREIGRKILSGQTGAEAEYRYMVMFNLTAITQLLWELSSQTNHGVTREKNIQAQNGLDSKNWAGKFLSVLLPLTGFLAGLGIGLHNSLAQTSRADMSPRNRSENRFQA